ncbi:MAG TPA: DUF6220 domain-containing protein [Ktedonobacterales bacterium]|nr:DUF6220 domain-containing protein [Ktedonobacterales bacterium]
MNATYPAPAPALTSAPVASDSALREQPAMTLKAPTPQRSTSPSRAAKAHRLIARVLLGALALQLFFAGLGVFGIASFLPHAILGTLIVATSFALPIVAWRGRLESALVRRSWLLAGLMVLQGLLIDAGRIVPAISALHPVNAMLLVLVTYSLATRKV